MSTSVIKTSLKIGLTLSAVTIVLMLVIESVNQWVLTERSISMLELTMDTELTLLVVVIGLLLATRYLLPDILQQAGYHLIRRREDKPDRQKLSMARWLLFGLAWRLAILLPSFEILLLILVWLFLPIGIVNNLVATILLWFYAFLLYALTCTVASAWLMRFPMGRYGLTLMKRPTDPPDASR